MELRQPISPIKEAALPGLSAYLRARSNLGRVTRRYSKFFPPLSTPAVGSVKFFLTSNIFGLVHDKWDMASAGPTNRGSNATHFVSPSFSYAPGTTVKT
jgi:hypothetical protein